MIKTFRCKDTSQLFGGKGVVRWVHFRTVAERKLQMLNRATRLEDLRVPPNNRLELLKGDRAGQFSIRINDQWRLTFKWGESGPYDVIIEDPH